MIYCTDEQRNRLLKNLLEVHERTGIVSVILLAQDPIGNYVVKKAVDTAPDGKEKQELWKVLGSNCNELVSFVSSAHRQHRSIRNANLVACLSQMKSQYARYITRKISKVDID